MDRNRLAAYEALYKIEKEGAYSNLAVGRAISEYRPDNEAFVRNLVYGVLENRVLIDYRLDEFIKSGIRKVQLRARILLRMGIYQIDYMDSVPEYAAVSETVRISRKKCPGLSSLVNGVLRSYLRSPVKRALPDRQQDPAAYLSVRYSYHRELADLWIGLFGEDRAEALMAAGNRTPQLTVCVNTQKTTVEQLSDILKTEGFSVEYPISGRFPEEQEDAVKSHALYVRGGEVTATEAFRRGLFYIQDISSMRAVSALSPLPGQKIIDVCSAPGGKSVFAALLMKDQGKILSCDIYEHKLELIRNTLGRLGMQSIEVRKKDAAVFDPAYQESADAVIADVPCSGLGVIRRRPEIKLRMTMERIRELPSLQYSILDNASRYVKKGGRILYSTCTISEKENEEVVRKFLKSHEAYSMMVEKQLFPDLDGSDGFYFCVMRRD